MMQLCTKRIYLILGKSSDDEATEGTSLGRCPDSRVADRASEDCIEWKIAVGGFAGAVFVLSVIILIVIVSRCKKKGRVSAQRNTASST